LRDGQPAAVDRSPDRRRDRLIRHWLWSYLTFNRSMRLITGAEASGDSFLHRESGAKLVKMQHNNVTRCSFNSV
jgi:hypothetical protein